MTTPIPDYYKQMYGPNRPVNTGTRIAAMLLDHIFMALVVAAVVIAAVVVAAFSSTPDDYNAFVEKFLGGPEFYSMMVAFSLYFCKDMFNGRSLAKRILKLQVVDHRTGLAATPLQCLVRNLFCIFWIIEVFVAIAHPSRRIGDYVAGTRLVYFDPEATPAPAPAWQWPAALLLALGATKLVTLSFPTLPDTHVAPGSHGQVNQAATQALSRLLTDSLGSTLTPDVKVYDPASKNKLPYVSILFTYPSPPEYSSQQHRQLSARVIQLVYSQLPADSLSGKITYSYKTRYNSNRAFDYIGNQSAEDTQP